MESTRDILPFPHEIPAVKGPNVLGVSIQARGNFSSPGSSEFHPTTGARILLLMSGSRDAIGDIHTLSIPCVPIDVETLDGMEDRSWKDMGREIAWMRAIGVRGRLMADTLSSVPFRRLFLNLRLPSDVFVIQGQLEKAVIDLPPEIQAPSLDHYFISGTSLRTVDTFKNRPGGGTRVAV